MNQINKLLILLLLCLVVIFSGCNNTSVTEEASAENTDSFYGMSFPFVLKEEIVIESAYLYTGAFPEDGSFDEKENVVTLKVRNSSAKDIQLVRIIAKTDNKDMLFEITTLPAGKSVLVSEKNADTLSEGDVITDITAENLVYFERPLSLNEDKFEISALEKVFNIRNISDSDIGSDIYVYYKKVNPDGDYYGGITFRSKADGLSSDELKQIPASHFSTEDSEVLFVDFRSE